MWEVRVTFYTGLTSEFIAVFANMEEATQYADWLQTRLGPYEVATVLFDETGVWGAAYDSQNT